LQKIIFYTILITLLLSISVLGQSLERDIQLEALDIDYDLEDNLVSARGEVNFRYGDIFVSCAELFIDLEREMLIARGDVSLREGEEIIKGEELQFFFAEGRGQIISPRTAYDELTLWGDRLEFTPEFSEIEKGAITPCILPDPHYRVSSRRVVISPEGRIDAYSVTVLWGETPIFFLPYYVARYEDGTITSPFPIPSFGYDSDKGFFLGLTFDHNITDKLKGEYFVETTSREHLFLGELLFEHEITQNWSGEYYFEFTSTNYIEILDLSISHDPATRVRGKFDLKKEKDEPWELGTSYGFKIIPEFEIFMGFKGRGDDYYLTPGWEYRGREIENSLALEWNLEGELHRLQGEFAVDGLNFSGDWQRYREQLHVDLGFEEDKWKWWIRQRRGTRVERLPQMRFSFNAGSGGAGFLDLGFFREGDIASQRIGARYSLNRDWGPFSARVSFEGYDYPQFDFQGALEGSLAWSWEWDSHDFAIGVSFREITGETPFDFDIIEKKQQVFSKWTAKFNENKHFPIYTAGLETELNLLKGKLEKLKGLLKKEEDCYFWSLEADPIRSDFEFTIGIPF